MADNRRTQPSASSFQVVSVPSDKLRPSPTQARKIFDEASLAELAASIKEQGLIQPIILCPLGDGTYELIAGERRLRAVKLLGWATIPAIVKEGVKSEDSALLGLIENLQREDLN